MAWLICVESFMSLQYEIWIEFFKIMNYNEVIYFFFSFQVRSKSLTQLVYSTPFTELQAANFWLNHDL